MNLFKTKYRIVTDNYLGYEVQFKKWWLPFWTQTWLPNTHPSIDEARQYIGKRVKFVVEEYNPHFNTKKNEQRKTNFG
jgi:hypothetical protein